MTADTIAHVFAWEAFDSRATPTVACEVRLVGGARGTAIVPSGASTGSYEAHELRDGGARFRGRGVQKAVANVADVLGAAVRGLSASDQEAVDAALRAVDGTADLSRLGGNAVLAVSIACALAGAECDGVPLWRRLAGDGPPLLPLPMVNIISGGAHAAAAIDIQDVLAVPLGAATFSQALEWAWAVRAATADVAHERGLATALVADEGGLAFPLSSNAMALELVTAGIGRAGLVPGADVALAVDVAANQFATGEEYRLATEDRNVTGDELVAMVAEWADLYPLVSVEDVCAEDDWAGWDVATKLLGDRLQLIGDDLFATNPGRLERAVATRVANSVLVKPNQNGTLSGAAQVVAQARAAGYAPVVSGRSGDTEDSWLADLAVGWRAGQVKVGSLTRSERLAKWNRLLRIEAERPAEAEFAGGTALARGRASA